MFIYVILKHCVESVWAVGSPGLKFLWRISCLQHGIMGNVVSASDVTPTERFRQSEGLATRAYG